MKAALTPIDHGNTFGERRNLGTGMQQPEPAASVLHQRRLRERVSLPEKSVPIRNSTSTSTEYKFPELKASARPGAMDAFSLPSITMGKRTYGRAR